MVIKMRLRDHIAHLSSATLARGMHCPYDWVPQLMDQEPPCQKGDDCETCIRRMLNAPFGRAAVGYVVDDSIARLTPEARMRIEEALREGKNDG